jgi:hypothetical protein
MQIDAAQSNCPDCDTAVEYFPVMHHMICAYVGPQYDFAVVSGGLDCPKCRRLIAPHDPACEIVGLSARCPQCLAEMPVSPGTTESAAPAG